MFCFPSKLRQCYKRKENVISMPHLTAPLSPKDIIQTVEAVLRLEMEMFNKVEITLIRNTLII